MWKGSDRPPGKEYEKMGGEGEFSIGKIVGWIYEKEESGSRMK